MAEGIPHARAGRLVRTALPGPCASAQRRSTRRTQAGGCQGRFRTARQIADWVDQRFQVRYSESGVKELLRRIGVSFHKVTGFLWKADAVEQEEWLDDYRRDPVGRTIRRYFIDACHPVWGVDMIYYCWLLVGQRFHVKVGSGRKRLNILG